MSAGKLEPTSRRATAPNTMRIEPEGIQGRKGSRSYKEWRRSRYGHKLEKRPCSNDPLRYRHCCSRIRGHVAHRQQLTNGGSAICTHSMSAKAQAPAPVLETKWRSGCVEWKRSAGCKGLDCYDAKALVQHRSHHVGRRLVDVRSEGEAEGLITRTMSSDWSNMYGKAVRCSERARMHSYALVAGSNVDTRSFKVIVHWLEDVEFRVWRPPRATRANGRRQVPRSRF